MEFVGKMNAYFLYGVNEEKLMVIKSKDDSMMRNIIDILAKSRDNNIREIAEILENHFNERHDDGGSFIQTRSKNKKNGRVRK